MFFLRLRLGLLVLAAAAILGGCQRRASEPTVPTLRLATTTSTYDSGLLDHILPDFESKYHAEVDVIAVGTGQALSLGESGDVDVVLVHAPTSEEAFVDAGHGLSRTAIMFNDFVVVGPTADPAGVALAVSAAEALQRIHDNGADFASRGDNSGTHIKELSLWALVELTPSEDWSEYLSLGQGMGATLRFAEEKDAYTLSDRGTFLALEGLLPHLAILMGGSSIADNPDQNLLNYYSIIPVNPVKSSDIAADLAASFVEWLTSIPVQSKIDQFGIATFGQALFLPNSEQWRSND